MSFYRRFPPGQTAGKTCASWDAVSGAGGQGEGSQPHGKCACLLFKWKKKPQMMSWNLRTLHSPCSKNKEGLARLFKGAFLHNTIRIILRMLHRYWLEAAGSRGHQVQAQPDLPPFKMYRWQKIFCLCWLHLHQNYALNTVEAQSLNLAGEANKRNNRSWKQQHSVLVSNLHLAKALLVL